MRRIGVIMALEEADPQAKAWLSSLTQGLSELGWTEGRNLRMDVRWPGGNADRIRMFAKELVDLQPEVIFGTSTPVNGDIASGNADHPDHICDCRRPGRFRLRYEPVASRG
jgi:ABC-type uncharacterized transport system substrate-binding protein